MGGYRIPGPMCPVRNPLEMDDGTLALTCTPAPGILGTVPGGSTLPYHEATELHECITIMGEGNVAYCRRVILGIPPALSSTSSTTSQRVGDVEVVDLLDKVLDDPQILTPGATRPSFEYILPKCRHRRKKVVNYTGPKKIRLMIQTIYKPGINPTSTTAGYGRGTTSQDRAAGNTSLAFHEKCHREDMVQYLKTHAFPKSVGRPGITIARCQQAIDDWVDAVKRYLVDMQRFSEINTDCVGTIIDQYYRSKGINKTVCPVK
jgi:hypothetical protein